MKEVYKGFEITISREECLGGWENTYWTIIRQSDLWIFEDDFTEGNDSLETIMEFLKAHVDDYLENPQDYEDDEA